MVRESSGYVELGGTEGGAKRIPLSKVHLQIGRSPSCDIWLADPSVSRRHARLEAISGGIWSVMDCGSRNGTFVNGKEVQIQTLANGDMLAFGNCKMVFRQSPAAPEEAPDLELEQSKRDTHTRVVDLDSMREEEVLEFRTFSQLHNIMRRLSKAQNTKALLAMLAQGFLSALKPDRLGVGLERDEEYDWPVVIDSEGQPTDGSDLPRKLVPRPKAKPGEPNTHWDGSESVFTEAATPPPKKSFRCYTFPIKSGTKLIGHIYAEKADPVWEPPTSDIQFLALLTRQAGLLVDNMQLLEESTTNKQLMQELAAARKIQIQQFPKELNLHAAVEIAAHNHPAFTVSGDYYDCQPAGDDRLAFIIADVMGHGIPAAILMTRLHAIFRLAVRVDYDLKKLDCQLDEVMQSASGSNVFATGILGLCDVSDSILEILCAGHPWPSIISGGKQISLFEDATTYPWGVSLGKRSLSPLCVPLRDDWSILTFTDGLAEVESSAGEVFSSERIHAFHAQNSGFGAEKLCESLYDQVLGFANPSAPLRDDMTLLAICSRRENT